MTWRFWRKEQPAKPVDAGERTVLDVCNQALEAHGDDVDMALLIVQSKDGLIHTYSTRIFDATRIGLLEIVRDVTISKFTKSD